MPNRICGGHCPIEYSNESTSINCRMCNKYFHLPCYDVTVGKSRVFITMNIVFICDACLDEIELEKSPKRKNVKSVNLKQSTLSQSGNGKVGLNSHPGTPTTISAGKGPAQTNEQLYSMMKSMAKTINDQTNKLNEIGQQVCDSNTGMMKLHKKQDDVFNYMTSRGTLHHERFTTRNARDSAHETFRPQPEQKQTNMSQTPKGNENPFGNSRRTYSTIVQSRLPVTPSETPRKREKTISLINNATGQTVKSVKFPTPKQGRKDVQIGRPVVERQITPRNVDPMSKSIWISRFHPDTTTEELESYVVEHTAAKDKMKFKCTKLVKKDADITKMSYVSFKIDATPEVYDILIDPENWPNNKQIREFVKMAPPKPTLANHFPSNSESATSEIKVPNANMMDVANELLNGGNSSVNGGNMNVIGNQSVSTPSKN